MKHRCVLAELQTQTPNMHIDSAIGFDALQRSVIPCQLEKLGAAECAACIASKGG